MDAIKKRRIRWLIIDLAIVLVFVTVATLGFKALHPYVMGSPDCVIESDYSYMTLFGERYVPLVLEDEEPGYSLGELVIREAQVKDTPFIGKLLFGDSVYAVEGCANNELVHLQTDYDLAASYLYCLESKVDTYKALAQERAYDRLTAEIDVEDGDVFYLTLNDTLSEMIRNADRAPRSTETFAHSHHGRNERITIHAAQTDEPFFTIKGELIRKHGEYFWVDRADIPPVQDNDDRYDVAAYAIDDRYDHELDVLFLYTYS